MKPSRNPHRPLLLSLFTVLTCLSTSFAAYNAPVWSKDGMAATPHEAATNAAVEILDAGGNAVDAAVAAAFALSVVEQYHSGLGGGEFALIYIASEDIIAALDARECAPAGATRDMYINPSTGEASSKKSWRGGLAVGVPGSVAGRVALIEKYGNLPLSKVIQPAQKLAEDGFLVDRILASRIKSKQDILSEDKAAGRVFLKDGKPLKRSEKLRQPQLAKTLSNIARDAGESFYHGKMAENIVAACQNKGGILTVEDLAAYKFHWRKPISFKYRGYEIHAMPPPSSGGVCLAEILNILEGFPMDSLEQGGADVCHLLASAFEAAFADRSAWLGDPDFNPVPTGGLTSKKHAENLREKIDPHYRKPVEKPWNPWMTDVGNTSHISVIDSEGNMCAITTSVNTAFGSLVFVPELGFFLNSTMDDFTTSAVEPNKYDLTGGNINFIESGKRPLSSMSPTLIFKEEEPYMCIGSVGGPRIITSVAQIIVNVIDFKMDIQAAIDAPRIHMQWKPDKLYLEDEFSPEVIEALRAKGWNVYRNSHWSLSQGVLFDREKGDFYGASDARGVGTAAPGLIR